jgi:hypothetical protein
MLSAFFRTAQAASQDGRPTLGQLFASDRSGLANSVPPDEGFLARFGDADTHDDPEVMALARSVSIYKRAAGDGAVDLDMFSNYVDALLVDMPAQTKLAQAVREAARRIAAIELSQLLESQDG